jgi:hypothetical protein
VAGPPDGHRPAARSRRGRPAPHLSGNRQGPAGRMDTRPERQRRQPLGQSTGAGRPGYMGAPCATRTSARSAARRCWSGAAFSPTRRLRRRPLPTDPRRPRPLPAATGLGTRSSGRPTRRWSTTTASPCTPASASPKARSWI